MDASARGQLMFKLADLIERDHVLLAVRKFIDGWKKKLFLLDIMRNSKKASLSRQFRHEGFHQHKLFFFQSLETLDNGKPFSASYNADLPLTIKCLR